MNFLVNLFHRQKYGKSDFAELIQPHIESMYRMAWQWTGSEEDAEDLIQDVLVNLAGRVTEMHRLEALRPWLIKVVYNRYVDIYRRRKKAPFIPWHEASQPEDKAESGVDDIKNLHDREMIQTAIEGLSQEQRDTILLHDVQGYSEEETAQRLCVSIGTVKSRLHRARKRMKLAIQQGTFSTSESF